MSGDASFGKGANGSSWPIWVPCVVFAHLFAAYFLLSMVALVYPKTWASLRRRFRRRSRASRASSGAGDAVHVNINKLSSVPAERVGSTTLQLNQLMVRQLLLEWHQVGCSYGSSSSGTKTVLHCVSGRVQPGEMAALMGPSGAGKSTLMDILACRKTVGTLTGRVLVNGNPPDKRRFTRETAYIPQEDNFLPSMTVAETALYYAALSLPRSWNAARRQERVTSVLQALGLSHTTNTLVGGFLPGGLALRGLSGGERKRLSIATGILATPAIVFLDEPTSGLDSYAALKIMGHLRSMSTLGGPSMVASIHQPRAAIWAMFDSATLLSAGHLMYTGRREGVVPWFESLGYTYHPGMHGLPSDWIMDLVNINFDRPVAHYGAMFSTLEELRAAAATFEQHWAAEQAELASPFAVPPEARDAAPGGGSGGGGRHRRSRSLTKLFGFGGGKASQAGGAAPLEGSGGGGADGDLPAGDQDVTARPVGSVTTPLPPLLSAVPSGAVVMKGLLTPQASGALVAAGIRRADSVSLRAEQQQRLQHVVNQLAAAQQAAAAAQQGGGEGGGSEAGGVGEGGGGAAGSPRASWLRQVQVLFWRELLAVTRNPADVAGRMLIFCWLGVFIGLIFYDLSPSLNGLRARLNVLFVQPVIFLLLPYVYMSLFTADKQYFIADVSSRLYSPSAYYLAKQLAIAPFSVLNTLVFSYTLYGMAGLRRDAVPFIGNGIISCLLYAIAAQVLSFAAIMAPNQDMAFMAAISWTAINLLMSNIMVRYVDMTNYWISALRYLSAMGYAFAGYSRLEFSGLSVSCANGLSPQVVDTLPAFLPTVTQLRSPFVIGLLKHPGDGCVVQLSAITNYFHVVYPLWAVVLILLGYLALVHLATFLGLLRLAKKEKR